MYGLKFLNFEFVSSQLLPKKPVALFTEEFPPFSFLYMYLFLKQNDIMLGRDSHM